MDYPLAFDAVLEEQRDFLICFLFLLKHSDKDLLLQWLKKESSGLYKKFFHTVHLCIGTFQYMEKDIWVGRMMEGSEVKSSAKTKASIESFYSAGGVPKRSTYRQQREQSKADSIKRTEVVKEGTREFKRRTLNRMSVNAPEMDKVDYNELLETNLSNEAMCVLLEVIHGYLDGITVEECSPQLFECVCLFIVTLLKNKQTFDFLVALFSFLR